MKKYEQLSDDQLDNLFREAESELAVPEFNPVFWNEVSAMIPVAVVPEKKRRKAIYFYLTGGIVFMFALAFVFSQFQAISLTEMLLTSNLKVEQNVSSKSMDSNNQNAANTLNFVKDNKQNVSKEMSDEEITQLVELIRKSSKKWGQPYCLLPSETLIQTEKETIVRLVPKQISFVQNDISFVESRPTTSTFLANNNNDSLIEKPNFEKGWFTQTALGIANNNPNNGSSLLSCVSRLGVAHQWVNKSSLFYTGVILSGDFAQKVIRQQKFIASNGSQTTVEHSYSSIYGVEFPLSFSYLKNQSSFGFIFTPGVQVFYKGQETIYENNSFVRSNNESGVIPSKSSLTMQVGFQYRRLLTQHFSINGSFDAYTLRSFNSQDFIGTYKKLPINGMLGVSYHF